MKLRVFVWAAALVGVLAIAAFAADVTGKWKAEFQTPNGDTRTSIFNLKADGEKLTGSVENPRGSTDIQDGKVSGDDVSFVVVRNFNGNEMKMRYKGKVSGDEMKLTVEIGDGDRTFEMTAKRQ